MARKDKVRAENAHVDEAGLRLFLDVKNYDGDNRDYVILERAYRGLTASYFEQFLDIALAEGVDLNAKNQDGQTLAEVMANHSSSEDYLEALNSKN